MKDYKYKKLNECLNIIGIDFNNDNINEELLKSFKEEVISIDKVLTERKKSK